MSGENGTDAGSTMRPISPGSPSSTSSRRRSGGRKIDIDNLSPEEIAKRERVRASARERQRKHRAGVKAKRMAELGMAIGTRMLFMFYYSNCGTIRLLS